MIGGGAGIQTKNNGFGVVGSTMQTQNAMITFAGLQAHGPTSQLSQAEAALALANRDHPDHGAVAAFVYPESADRIAFENRVANAMPEDGGSKFNLPLPDLADVVRTQSEQLGAI